MREASFVQRNKEKWAEVESNLKNKLTITPDALASDYIELTNDLAYAQTFYPDSKTEEYLNELSIYAHQSIYRDRKSTRNQLFDFFKKDVPCAVYEIRRPLFYSLLITLLATLIGWASAHYDTGFVRLILGDFYVDRTIQSIKEGNPAAIYSSGGQLGSFLAITINNVRVAFFAFALGIFFSIGTGYILFSNGIMLGAFHYLFYKYGVLGTAMSAIWIHGAFEISVIIIAGGCGIALGNSFMFPGSFKRIDSFKMMVRKASIILVSTIPFFIVAGFLEGFVTRHYQFALPMSLSVILICFGIIIFYFIIYPYQIQKKHLWKN
jgi:uncharacterized membrane protein SpoIIM required for sporulation